MKRASLAFAAVVGLLGPLACSDAPDDASTPRDTRRTSATFTGRVSGTGTSGLRIREKPTTASAQIANLAEGESIAISCRARGEIIEGNADWDFIPAKQGYVADAFVTVEGAIPRCDDGDEPTLPPAPPAGNGGPVDIEGPAVRPHVQAFIDAACAAVGACRASTYEGHSPQADLALDIPSGEGYGKLPTDGHVFGDKVAEFALANQTKFKIDYVIYRQRMNLGDGWDAMDDRGGITQNHFDHVHVSFEP